ncbi:MAG TPA: hypothetical protein VL334_09050 [Anaerolineae bacterium]|nr:hypothetical protein [Anaerolineae bacterium]
MSKPRDSVIWGAILVVIGAGFLVWNLGILAAVQVTIAWTLMAFFALLGLSFVFSYLNKRSDWWRLIPAFTLLAVAAVLFLSTRGVASAWVAAALLSGIALAFLVIYASDREERWWALIPFGSVMVMVVVILLGARPATSTALLGAVLFGGMGLVFFLIYALARDRQRFGWALVPTAALGVMALVALAAYAPQAIPALAEATPLWPVLVVLFGLGLIGYAAMRSRRAAPPAVELPSQPAAAETPWAPGASVTAVSDDEPAARPARIERSPVTPVDETPAASASGEVQDIYEFLKNAPPEGNR